MKLTVGAPKDWAVARTMLANTKASRRKSIDPPGRFQVGAEKRFAGRYARQVTGMFLIRQFFCTRGLLLIFREKGPSHASDRCSLTYLSAHTTRMGVGSDGSARHSRRASAGSAGRKGGRQSCQIANSLRRFATGRNPLQSLPIRRSRRITRSVDAIFPPSCSHPPQPFDPLFHPPVRSRITHHSAA